MTIIDCEQLSPEWWDARRGMPTASNFDRIITAVGKQCALRDGHTGGHKVAEKGEKVKSEGRCEHMIPQYSAQAEGYIHELVADMIDQRPNYFTTRGKPVTEAMQHGVDTEPEARKWLKMRLGQDIPRVGFCVSDCGRWGCSPDGLIGEDGGAEIKCVQLTTQIRYLLEGELPPEYAAQVHGSLIVTGRKYWKFLSYNPTLDSLGMIIHVEPNDFTDALRAALEVFDARYKEVLARFGLERRKAVAA